jgi:hypothetical protein
MFVEYSYKEWKAAQGQVREEVASEMSGFSVDQQKASYVRQNLAEQHRWCRIYKPNKHHLHQRSIAKPSVAEENDFFCEQKGLAMGTFKVARSLFAILLGISCAPAMAAEVDAKDAKDEITTDRPDFVESSNVVGKGRWQIETSVAAERSHRDGVRERLLSTPTLLRVGLTDTLEFRLETDGRLQSQLRIDGAAPVTTNGYADTAIGIKWHALDALGGMPSIGVLAHLDLDSGSGPFRANGKGGSLRLVAEWELPGDMSLGVMPGLSTQHDEQGRRYTAGIFGIVLGKEFSQRWRGFAELSAPTIASSAHGGTVAALDIGTAWLLTPTAQLDTAISRGLNKHTADLAWTVGLSIKF